MDLSIPDIVRQCEEQGLDRLTLEKMVELVHGFTKQDFMGEFIESRYDEIDRDLEELRSISFRGRREYEKIYFKAAKMVKEMYQAGKVTKIYPGEGFDPVKDEFFFVQEA